MKQPTKGQKIAIIGAGNVGSSAAYALIIKNIVSEINIIDLNEEKSKGEVMDIADGLSFVETGNIIGADFKDARDADIIIITAGQRQQPGDTRLNLVDKNKKVIESIFKKIGKIKKDAIIIVVSNPVDVLAYHAQKITGLPPAQVIGSGTALDTSRLRTKLAKEFNVSTKNIHGYIFGEHGDSEFIAWSSITVGGIPIKEIKGFNDKVAKKIEKEINRKAYEIIGLKGSTYYGIGLTVANIVEAIIYDQHLVLPVSSMVKNWNGVSDLYIGSLAIIGRNGVAGHWPLKLNSEEKKKLKKSAKIIKKYL